MNGFRVFTPGQLMVVAALTLLSVGDSPATFTLALGAASLSLTTAWSVAKYYIEKRRWNSGVAANGLSWRDTGRRSLLLAQLYCAGSETYWFVHFDPSTKAIWLVR